MQVQAVGFDSTASMATAATAPPPPAPASAERDDQASTPRASHGVSKEEQKEHKRRQLARAKELQAEAIQVRAALRWGSEGEEGEGRGLCHLWVWRCALAWRGCGSATAVGLHPSRAVWECRTQGCSHRTVHPAAAPLGGVSVESGTASYSPSPCMRGCVGSRGCSCDEPEARTFESKNVDLMEPTEVGRPPGAAGPRKALSARASPRLRLGLSEQDRASWRAGLAAPPQELVGLVQKALNGEVEGVEVPPCKRLPLGVCGPRAAVGSPPQVTAAPLYKRYCNSDICISALLSA